jgi:hypothetical protein
VKLLVIVASVIAAFGYVADAQQNHADFTRQIVGEWEGPRHIRVFYADGGFSLDPQPGDKPMGKWKINGNQPQTQFHEEPAPMRERIAKITDTEMITIYRGRRSTYKRVQRQRPNQAMQRTADRTQ